VSLPRFAGAQLLDNDEVDVFISRLVVRGGVGRA
jgi:hypothetical protein